MGIRMEKLPFVRKALARLAPYIGGLAGAALVFGFSVPAQAVITWIADPTQCSEPSPCPDDLKGVAPNETRAIFTFTDGGPGAVNLELQVFNGVILGGDAGFTEAFLLSVGFGLPNATGIGEDGALPTGWFLLVESINVAFLTTPDKFADVCVTASATGGGPSGPKPSCFGGGGSDDSLVPGTSETFNFLITTDLDAAAYEAAFIPEDGQPVFFRFAPVDCDGEFDCSGSYKIGGLVKVVPEPAALGLLGAGLFGLGALYRRRRHS